MKSERFCFNTAVFRKNVIQFSPLWIAFFLVLLVMVPFSLWGDLHSYAQYYAADAGESGYTSMILYFFCNAMNTLDVMVYVVAGMAVLSVMAVFGYLFSARQANMMHAFPVAREELFVTNLAAAMSFLLIPEFAACLVTVLVCLQYGITCVQYAALYFLILAVESLLFLAVSLFAAMLTGAVYAVPVIAASLCYFYIFFRTMVGSIVCANAYGITDDSVWGDDALLVMAPISYFGQKVRFRAAYVTNGAEDYLTALDAVGLSALGWYVPAALLLLAASFFLYRKRPLEKTGDLAAFYGLSPAFRWLIGLAAGYAAKTGIDMSLEAAEVYLPNAADACVVVFAGMLAFFLCEMLMQKRLRIFCRRIAKESLAFALCVAASFLLCLFISRTVERYVPDEEDIASVNFRLSYAFDVSGEESGEILAIQRELISHGQEWLKKTRGSSDYANIAIIYNLKNGTTAERYYKVPLDGEGVAVIARASALERRAEFFLQANVGASDTVQTTGPITGTFDLNYSEDTEFDAETAAVLIEAIRQDAAAGTIQKYNSISENGTWDEAEETKYCGYVSFTIPLETASEGYFDYEGDYGEEQSERTTSVSFGEDCTALVKALTDTGLLGSKDELLLYSEY